VTTSVVQFRQFYKFKHLKEDEKFN
jgi:hypothetical protein